jgi:hypothetical protein
MGDEFRPVGVGVITQVGSDGGPVELSFSQRGRLLFSVTPEGELVLGDGIKPGDAGEILVAEFGHAYASALRQAEARVTKAEVEAVVTRRERNEVFSQIKKLKHEVELRQDRVNTLTKQVAMLEGLIAKMLPKPPEPVAEEAKP